MAETLSFIAKNMLKTSQAISLFISLSAFYVSLSTFISPILGIEMAGKRRRRPEQEYRYEVEIASWDARVVFNEYAYINLFNREPFAERYYIKLNGSLRVTSSKKIKKGIPAEIVLHPTTEWEKPPAPDHDSPIGDLVIESNPKAILARISIPMRSYELIRSYLTYNAKGRVELVGTDIDRRNAKIFYIGFNSETRTASSGEDE